MKPCKRLILACIFPMLLSACGSYDFKVNDRLVYSALERFSDYSLSDPALDNCVAQTIAANNIRQARQLRILDCSDAGIQSLDGLQVFTHLEQIDLRNNEITEAEPLAEIAAIRVLLLAGNNMQRAEFLKELPVLEQGDISANPQLVCATIAAIRSATLKLPAHCLEPHIDI